MTDRPSKQELHRGASDWLELQRAAIDVAQAEGFGSFELDLTTGEAHYSEGLRRILAVPDGVALTRELFYERIHPADRDVVTSAVERARRDGAPLRFEIRVTRFDDIERVIRGRGEAVSPGEPGPTKLTGTLQDVTEEATTRSARDLLSYVVQS